MFSIVKVCQAQKFLIVVKGPGEARINSIDFHRLEDLLVTASEDDSINVYDTSRGSLVKTLHSKKYGVANVKFTHSHHAVLYASSKVPLLPTLFPTLLPRGRAPSMPDSPFFLY